MKRYSPLVFVLTAVVSGCVGYDSTLFVTKTNYGVDFSTTPPTASIDISRTEGVVSPQFEEGKTVPVLASFKASGNNVFSASLGSAFATGNAAKTLAVLYDQPTRGPVAEGALSLDANPLKEEAAGQNGKPMNFQQHDVRPVLFGTKTSLGLNIGWSNMTALAPDSFTLGYNRKEMALVPITKKEVTGKADDDDNKYYLMNMAPLLATLDFVNTTTTGGENSVGQVKTDYLQYFATGEAASELATHPEVRMAMIRRLDPEAGFKTGAVGYALPVIVSSVDVLKKLQESDPYAKTLYQKLEGKTYDMPYSLVANKLSPYAEPRNDTITIDPKTDFIKSDKASDFTNLIAYLGTLTNAHANARDSLELAMSAKAENKSVTLSGFGAMDGARVPNDDDLKRIGEDATKLQAEMFIQRERLETDQDIYNAFKYLSVKLTSGG
jgi:hypothetical protein